MLLILNCSQKLQFFLNRISTFLHKCNRILLLLTGVNKIFVKKIKLTILGKSNLLKNINLTGSSKKLWNLSRLNQFVIKFNNFC